MSVSDRDRKILEVLGYHYDADCNCLSFKYIAQEAGMDIKLVRRIVRSLARKGLTHFERGLFDDEGNVAGSGYRCTSAGMNFLKSAP